MTKAHLAPAPRLVRYPFGWVDAALYKGRYKAPWYVFLLSRATGLRCHLPFAMPLTSVHSRFSGTTEPRHRPGHCGGHRPGVNIGPRATGRDGDEQASCCVCMGGGPVAMCGECDRCRLGCGYTMRAAGRASESVCFGTISAWHVLPCGGFSGWPSVAGFVD